MFSLLLHQFNNSHLPVFFCLPREYFPTPAWIDAWERGEVLPLEEKGMEATGQAWIYQTWALLIRAAVPCSLLEGLPQLPPEGGIIIAMSGSFPSIMALLEEKRKQQSKPRSWVHRFFLVDIVADGLPHPVARLHVVQNRAHAQRLSHALFMPHWPQPNLIPRDEHRGNRFEKVAFFGDIKNLAPELRSKQWQESLKKKLGITLELPSAAAWHDYHDIDGVIAVRDFSPAAYLQKPATKLYNAWHAGVPFIGGNDSAYRADGTPNENYLVANSAAEVFEYLRRLKEEESFRRALVEKGFQQGAAYTQEATLQRWKKLIQETLPALARQWQRKLAWEHAYFLNMQKLHCFWDRLLR